MPSSLEEFASACRCQPICLARSTCSRRSVGTHHCERGSVTRPRISRASYMNGSLSAIVCEESALPGATRHLPARPPAPLCRRSEEPVMPARQRVFSYSPMQWARRARPLRMRLAQLNQNEQTTSRERATTTKTTQQDLPAQRITRHAAMNFILGV